MQELPVSIKTDLAGQSAIGNIVGLIVFNILSIAGVFGLVARDPCSRDQPVRSWGDGGFSGAADAAALHGAQSY
jgi:Ca2+/Na+ antiporter